MADRRINTSDAPCEMTWSHMRQSTHTFTFEELSNFSQLGINLRTVAVARALCSQFTPAAGAKQNLDTAREAISTEADNRIRCVLLKLAALDEGLTALGICGVLSDYFHPESVALVFESLAKTNHVPGDLMPTDRSWYKLACVCEHLHLPDTFHLLMERYSRLDTSGQSGTVSSHERRIAHLEHTGADCVTEALQVMSALCSGKEQKSLVIFGGCDAGWLAAVAEWLFDLNIEITAEDGRVLVTKCGSGQLPQLTLAFHNRGVPCKGDPVEVSSWRTRD